MKRIKGSSRKIPVAEEADIAVLGGGPGGLTAAVAAARLGAKVLLIERYGCLGGLAAGGLVLHMMAIFGKSGRRWIGGLPWELLERLRGRGGLFFETPSRPYADSELLKVVAEEMCLQAGVKLRLHTWAVDAVVRHGSIRGVITESKSGRRAVLARCVIDATGDADIAAAAGACCLSAAMPIGLPVKVCGIDIDAFRGFQAQHPEEAGELVRQAVRRGGFSLNPRAIPGSSAGIYWINIRGISEREDGGRLDPLDVDDLTYAETRLRRRILVSLDHYRKNAPGFEKVGLVAFASQLGVRESRHIDGLYRLDKEDGERGRSFSDAVGTVALYCGAAGAGSGKAGAASGESDHLSIPFRCLVPRTPEGMLVAGRCASVDSSVADTMRLIPPCMVTGQASGTAAALALAAGKRFRDLEAAVLRRRLESDGVIFA